MVKNIFKSVVTFFTQSSEDPSKTSLTLNGILITLAAYLQLNTAVVTPFINQFIQTPIGHDIQIVFSAILIISGWIVTAVGLFRKFTNKVEKSSGLRVE